MKQRIGKRMSDKKQTHFGFRTVDEDAKASMVHGVFSSVASRYDLMNDLMSAGIHRVWKNAMMDWLAPRDGQHLLDVAGGTGDVAFRFLDRAPGGRVTVCDMTESMLVEGRKRADAVEKGDRLAWVTGDAMALPFADASFDRYTISFGIRNVTRIPDALAEAYRVLKPGGRLVVVTFHSLEDRIVKRFMQARSNSAGGGSRYAPVQETAPAAFTMPFRRAIGPDPDEEASNPRARSALLRVAVRTDAPAGAVDADALAMPRLPKGGW